MPSPLEQLSARALDWLGAHLDFFDPFSSSGRSAPHGKAKAALELALLCHRAARPDAGPDPLGGATALVRKLWQDPDFPGLFDELPAYASTYGLIYAALAPDGIDDTLCRDRLALLPPEFLAPEGKSPYQRVEIRYYAACCTATGCSPWPRSPSWPAGPPSDC